MASGNHRPRVDIEERTFAFAVSIVRFCRQLGRDREAQPLVRQLLRSGTSVGANMAEAQAAQSRKDFVSKISIAQKEARETLYWLRLLTASGIVTSASSDLLMNEADQLTRIITAIARNARATTAVSGS